MSEALTREAALDWLNDLADELTAVTVNVLWIHQEIETRVVFLVGRFEHFEEDHPNYRRGSFAVDDNALELGDLLEDGVPAHSFARPGYALSEGKLAIYAGASMRVEIDAPTYRLAGRED